MNSRYALMGAMVVTSALVMPVPTATAQNTSVHVVATRNTNSGAVGQAGVAFEVVAINPTGVQEPVITSWQHDPGKVPAERMGAVTELTLTDTDGSAWWHADGSRLVLVRQHGAGPDAHFEPVVLDLAAGDGVATLMPKWWSKPAANPTTPAVTPSTAPTHERKPGLPHTGWEGVQKVIEATARPTGLIGLLVLAAGVLAVHKRRRAQGA